MDTAAASVIARWIDLRAARADLPLRLNLRLRFGSPAIASAVRDELKARSDERRQFFVRTSNDEDAVALRHGRPHGVAPTTTVVYVLFWLPGSDGHANYSQSLQDLRGFDVHDLLRDEALVFDGEQRIEQQIAEAAGAWATVPQQQRAHEHLGAAWKALRNCLRFGRGGREGSVPFVRSLESWLRFLDRAAVPVDAWTALPDAQRAAAILVRWGRSLPELGLFQLSELASVLGASVDPAQTVQKRSATGEARWPAALTDMLGQNLEVALDPTGLGEQIAGKSSLEDQLDKVLPKIQLCRDGDPAAARLALERFCLEGDERALGAVEWLFHENRDNRRSPSMGVRGVLVARRSERGRRTPLMRATDETFEALRGWLGDKTPEADVVGQQVNEAIGRQAPGFHQIADMFDALAEGNAPQEPSELRKALEKALTSPSWDPTAARRVASRWRRLRQGAAREREVSGTSVLWGLVDLVRRWRADESPTLEQADKLVLRFESKTPVEHELRPGIDGAAGLRERLARFLLDKVRTEVFPENGEATPEEVDEDVFHELSFTVERERQRERELVGRLHVYVSDAARELWRATCVSPLPRWRLQLDGELAGRRLLRQVCKAIEDKQGTYGVQVTDAVDAAWSAYVRQAAPKGVDVLAQVAPLPPSARSLVEAWSGALQPLVDVASAGRAGPAVAELEAEMGRALDAGDFPRAQELHRHIREARERRPVGADTALAQARSLLSMAAAEIFDGAQRARFLLTPHHPLVLRLRGVEDDLLAGILGELWAGGWQDASGAELTEAVADWGLPEPTHAWCAWDGDPLVFEAWLDGGSAAYSRLGASREDDAGSLGCRAAADVVRRYRDLNPLAADRLRLRVQADRRGEWAETVISDLLGRAFAADIDLVTDLPERTMTALEEALVHDRESAEAFELGPDGTLPRVRLRRVGNEPAGSSGAHLALVVGEKIDALAAEWHWQPASAPPDGADVWDSAVLFDASLPQITGVVDLVAGPEDALSRRAAMAMGVAKGSQVGTIPVERQSFDPSRCAAPIVAAQGSAHWLVLASRRPLYRAVQQVGPEVATLLDFQTRMERGRPVHVCISLGARYAAHELRALTAKLGDLLGKVDSELAPALLRHAQKVAPELALRCLGTGGGADLIGLLGLLLAAHWLEEQGGEGLVLALDQHQSLLTSRRRGDLLRVSEVRGAVRIQVCEAKCSTLPLTPDAAPMQHALRQIEATIAGLARLQARHALSARTRLKLARALIQQAHMLGADHDGSAQLTRLVELVRDPAVVVEVEEGGHVALGFSLGGHVDSQKDVATSEVRVFGRATTLARLDALQHSA